MTSRSIVSPAGTPSRIATSALPCDSPAVRKRSIRASFYPKNLPCPGGVPSIFRVIRAGRSFALTSAQPQTEDVMQLVADRFAIDEDGRSLDLATGASVVLIVGSAG